ncbi:MAG: hypothetical protein ABH969_10065 [Pseudomonadota bacterium]
MPEKTENQKLDEILELTREIHAALIMGKVPEPGQEEFKRAVAALVDGNKSLLAAYYKRGGK